MTYPLHLDLSGRRVLVVGGGPVAARRARGCADAGARVVVVAPAACEDVRDLALAGRVDLVLREWEPGDGSGAWLVHAATGDRDVDAAVAAEADAAGTWCVRADDASATTARVPAVVRRDDVVVTVASATGADPRRSRRIASALAQVVDAGRVSLRRSRPGPGRVDLVGGGPGDPGLLTLTGRRLLAAADVVVVDRLAPLAVLDELDDDVLVVDVGKAPDHHPVPQEEIGRLLVEHAQAGRRVVRLKGGDPFVLGRGGEEVVACQEAGVPVGVVPGVTSAVAVPAAAGVPVTHRGSARAFTVVTGHDADDAAALAGVPGTLVVLMGVGRLAALAEALVQGGRAPSTPVAVVERGCTPEQRTTRATLADVAAVAAARGVEAPAVVVVGDVAALELVDVPA